jgi:hypothetical protein
LLELRVEPDRIVIYRGQKLIAQHPRSYGTQSGHRKSRSPQPSFTGAQFYVSMSRAGLRCTCLATLLKADGKDILSVKMHLNSERQAEKDAETVAAEIEGEDLSL